MDNSNRQCESDKKRAKKEERMAQPQQKQQQQQQQWKKAFLEAIFIYFVTGEYSHFICRYALYLSFHTHARAFSHTHTHLCVILSNTIDLVMMVKALHLCVSIRCAV